MAQNSVLNASLKKRAKKHKWLTAFTSFIRELRINSKEVAPINDDRGGSELALWDSQRLFLETLCDGLEDGVREFYFLKSRQLGITTVGMAIVLFWLAVHPQMIGCLVADDNKNSNGFRETIRSIMKSFPESFVGSSFKIINDNKDFMVFSNGSRLDFLVAGKHKVNWAESKGYTLCWLTEVSKYGKKEGIDSFRETMAQSHPDRLVIFESTANGFANLWHDMWLAAGDDHFTKRRRFIGWWSNPLNSISPHDGRYARYGRDGPNGEEAELIEQVAELYGYVVTMQQLAWYRWRQADKSVEEGMLGQNQPWTEHQAFVQTGSSFFQMRLVQRKHEELAQAGLPFRGYRFILGTNIFETRMEEITTVDDIDMVELRLWEDPVNEGQYVIGCDPAYGRTDWADRHAIQVWRCYGDKLIQVAEYADERVETHHCAWVLAYLAGAYRNCLVNLELGGPGRAILREFNQLRDTMRAEIYAKRIRDLEWEDFLDMARWYLYHRPDSMGTGFAISFECLSLNTPLPTPGGWTTMGDVQKGEYLLSDTGHPTKVVGVSDIKTESKCYELKFDDGTIIVADENHWWKVARRHWKGGADKLRTTSQLRAGKFYIRLAAPLMLPDTELPINPYLLGAWLGDGASAAAGVLNNKHIPDVYLRASHDQRLALLQGLMDTDGTVTEKGRCAFVTTSKAIAAGFSELVRSLGFKAKYLIWDESPAKGTECALRYRFWFTAYPETPVFRLTRKADRLANAVRKHRNKRCHRIVSIREVESVPVRCVMVDSPTKMFLAGEGMIPTHNTTWKSKMEIMNQLRDSFTTDMLEIRSLPFLEEMSTMVQTKSDIGPSGAGRAKDDRVFAAALANRAWIDWVRGPMIQEGATYEIVTAAEQGELSVAQQMVKRIVFDFWRTAEERSQMPERSSWLQDRGLI